MASVKEFLCKAMEIAAEEPGYQLGHRGDGNLCDCIGLVIGALSRCGVKWPGIHGSNWAARNAVSQLSPIRSASDLASGELVFKSKSPGQSGYALPGRYAGHPDCLDYYHVGIVVSAAPLRVLHMTKPAPRVDLKVGNWSHHGWCSLVSADETKDSAESNSIPATPGTSEIPGTPGTPGPPGIPETPGISESSGIPEKEREKMSKSIVVKSPNGGSVKLRKHPSTASSTWWEVASGSEGFCFSESGAWSHVEVPDAAGKLRSGWMQSKFVVEANGVDNSEGIRLPTEVVENLLDCLAEMEKQLDAMYEMLGGRG